MARIRNENTERRREYQKEWYLKNKTRLTKERELNKEKRKEYRESPRGTYVALRRRNEQTGHGELELSYKDFLFWWESTPRMCCYCRRPLVRGRSMNAQSIDRKDASQGYSVSNIVFACKRCNTMKGNWLTYEQMRDAAKRYLFDTD